MFLGDEGKLLLFDRVNEPCTLLVFDKKFLTYFNSIEDLHRTAQLFVTQKSFTVSLREFNTFNINVV